MKWKIATVVLAGFIISTWVIPTVQNIYGFYFTWASWFMRLPRRVNKVYRKKKLGLKLAQRSSWLSNHMPRTDVSVACPRRFRERQRIGPRVCSPVYE